MGALTLVIIVVVVIVENGRGTVVADVVKTGTETSDVTETLQHLLHSSFVRLDVWSFGTSTYLPFGRNFRT